MTSRNHLLKIEFCLEGKHEGVLWFVLCFLPVWMLAQSPFDGTWRTNLTASKLSQKPYEFSS